MRLNGILLTTAVLAAVAVAALPAAAKEGVRAVLTEPVDLSTPPREHMQIKWRLLDEEGRPFGASGIYLRVSRCGGGPRTVSARARGRGRYVARVRVPAGGIRRLLVGLQGWRITPTRTTRADRYFQFDPPLYRRCD